MFVGWNFCPYGAYMGTIVTVLFAVRISSLKTVPKYLRKLNALWTNAIYMYHLYWYLHTVWCLFVKNTSELLWHCLKFLFVQFTCNEVLYTVLLLWWSYASLFNDFISPFITPPTSFSQSRRSIDVTWRHTLSPRYTQRQKPVTGIHWKCLLSAK